ncbi:MAG: cytochrome c [Ferrovibrio sp.]
MSRSAKAVFLALALVVLAASAQAQSQSHSRHKSSGIGRAALPEEIAAWDIAVRPDGRGLPEGSGGVKQGEEVFMQQCASCHGEFAEGNGRWPVLAGGFGSLKGESPEKTIGSFWPYLSTSYDYIRRAMPFGNAQSLSADDTYAIVAFLLFMNDQVKEDFVLSKENFASIALPNQNQFYDDDREVAEKQFWKASPCMKGCKQDVKILNHARALDVTPEDGGGNKVD